ncbi:MAG: ABC transporter permease [Rhodospirillales bacterium]
MKISDATVAADASRLSRRLSAMRTGWRSNASSWRRIGSVLLALAVWELAARIIDNPLFFVSLTQVAVRGVQLWDAGELQVHIGTSLTELAIGLFLGIVVGIAIGAVMASSVALEDMFDPWVSMIYSMPIIALGPLFILWFGIGIASKVAIVFLMAVFPVIINSYTGLKNTDRDLLEAARSFASTPLQVFFKVRLPAAVPFIVSGIRNAISRGLIGVVVSEFFGAEAGLGFLILYSAQVFDTAALFVGVFILAFGGIGAVEILRRVERRVAPWQARDDRN